MASRGNQQSKKDQDKGGSPPRQSPPPGGKASAPTPGVRAAHSPAKVTMGKGPPSKKKGAQEEEDILAMAADLDRKAAQATQAKADAATERNKKQQAEQQRLAAEKQAREVLAQAKAHVPGLLQDLQQQVGQLLLALGQLLAPPGQAPPQPLDAQTLLAQAETLWGQLDGWSTKATSHALVISYLDTYLPFGRQAVAIARSLAAVAKEVTQSRARIAQLEREIADLRPEAARLDAAEVTLQRATAEVALRQAALRRAMNAVDMARSGEWSGLADTAEDIVGEQRAALEEAERQLAAARLQKQQALAAQQSLTGAEAGLAAARSAEATATESARKTRTSTEDDLALDKELLNLAGGPEKLSALLVHVPDRRRLHQYLRALGPSLLNQFLSDKQLMPQLEPLLSLFGQQGLEELAREFKGQLAALARLFDPKALHAICDPAGLGVGRLLDLVTQFLAGGAHKRIFTDYKDQQSLRAMLDLFGAKGLAEAEQKLKPQALIQWHGWFPGCLKELVLSLPASHLSTINNLCVGHSAALAQLVPLLTVPTFASLVTEVTSEQALEMLIANLGPAQIVTVVDAVPPKKLGQLLGFQDVLGAKGLPLELHSVCRQHKPKLQLLSAANLRRLLIAIAQDVRDDLLAEDAATISRVFAAFTHTTDEEFDDVLALGVAQVVAIVSSPNLKQEWLTAQNISSFLRLLIDRDLSVDVINTYGLVWLINFRGSSDTHHHLTQAHVKSNGHISGGHAVQAFEVKCTEQGYAWTVTGVDDGVIREVTYGPPGGWTAKKTLLMGLPANYQTWKARANEAIWDAIRRGTFPVNGGKWVGRDSAGQRFAGFQQKKDDSTVATWWPQ